MYFSALLILASTTVMPALPSESLAICARNAPQSMSDTDVITQRCGEDIAAMCKDAGWDQGGCSLRAVNVIRAARQK